MVDHPNYCNREELVEWSQMKLERVDVTASVLADLLEAAYKDGKKQGRDDERNSNCDGPGIQFVKM